jgi:hypothetical protein
MHAKVSCHVMSCHVMYSIILYLCHLAAQCSPTSTGNPWDHVLTRRRSTAAQLSVKHQPFLWATWNRSGTTFIEVVQSIWITWSCLQTSARQVTPITCISSNPSIMQSGYLTQYMAASVYIAPIIDNNCVTSKRKRSVCMRKFSCMLHNRSTFYSFPANKKNDRDYWMHWRNSPQFRRKWTKPWRKHQFSQSVTTSQSPLFLTVSHATSLTWLYSEHAAVSVAESSRGN